MSKKIKYIHNGFSSFVQKDLAIINEEFEVETIYFKLLPKWRIPFRVLFYFIQGIKDRNRSVYLVQFSGFHALPAAFLNYFFKTPLIIVLGGTDCVKFESISYGNFTRNFLGWATEFCLKNSTLLLPVDHSLVLYDYVYQKNDTNKQGYKAHCKSEIRTPFKVIYNGYDSSKWHLKTTNTQKKTSFVTVVSSINSRFAIPLKGLDLIFEIAPFFKDYEFYIVGGHGLKKNIKISDNVKMIEHIPNDSLNGFLNDKKYYLQLSISEGFPNALCESILSGCVPIVSGVGAMPFIVQNESLVLKEKSVEKLIQLIQKLEMMPPEILDQEQLKIRNRLINEFSLERRKKELIDELKKHTN
jgi:glycosyltransferase involved in cell wall biosynthesis